MTTTPAAHPAKDLRGAIRKVLEHHAKFGTVAEMLHEAVVADLEAVALEHFSIAPGQPGYVTRTICYPEPLKVVPKEGDLYLSVIARGAVQIYWENCATDKASFAAGLCYPATPEGEEHAKLAWQARFGGERG